MQWLAVLAFALTVRHNGWLYLRRRRPALALHRCVPPRSHGCTSARSSATAGRSCCYPSRTSPVPNLVSALPAIVLFNTLVLLPVALLCIYGIAARIGGRLFGYLAAALWIALPYFGILFVEPGYHQKYTELTLPHIVGLTAMSGLPGMVGLLVSAYFCLRALEIGSRYDDGGRRLRSRLRDRRQAVERDLPRRAPLLLLLDDALAYALAVRCSDSRRPLADACALEVPRPRAARRRPGGAGPAGERRRRPARGGSTTRTLNSWAHFHEILIALREHFWVARVHGVAPARRSARAPCARAPCVPADRRRGSPPSWPSRGHVHARIGRGRELLPHPDARVPCISSC